MGWHESSNYVGPFVRSMLGVILVAYREFEERIPLVSEAKLTKTEREEAALRDPFGKVTKRHSSQACPDISTTTIKRALANLLANGKAEKTEASTLPANP